MIDSERESLWIVSLPKRELVDFNLVESSTFPFSHSVNQQTPMKLLPCTGHGSCPLSSQDGHSGTQICHFCLCISNVVKCSRLVRVWKTGTPFQSREGEKVWPGVHTFRSTPDCQSGTVQVSVEASPQEGTAVCITCTLAVFMVEKRSMPQFGPLI